MVTGMLARTIWKGAKHALFRARTWKIDRRPAWGLLPCWEALESLKKMLESRRFPNRYLQHLQQALL
jgi:hypothetical protein